MYVYNWQGRPEFLPQAAETRELGAFEEGHAIGRAIGPVVLIAVGIAGLVWATRKLSR